MVHYQVDEKTPPLLNPWREGNCFFLTVAHVTHGPELHGGYGSVFLVGTLFGEMCVLKKG